MIKIRFPLGLILLAAFLLFSACATVSGYNTGEYCLWQYRNGDQTIHILGTVHSFTSSQERLVYPLPDTIRKRVSAADTLFLEVVHGQVDFREEQEKEQNLFFYSSGESIENDLTLSELEKVSSFVESRGLQLPDWQKMRLWYLTDQIFYGLIDTTGQKQTRSMERELQQIAEKNGADVMGLEHPFDYFRLSNQVERSTQKERLLELVQGRISQAQMDPSENDALIMAWVRGDIREYERITAERQSLNSANELFTQILNAQRNTGWAETIEELSLQTENLFIAVGASHLVGENNLISLLHDRGMIFEQVRD